MERPGCKILDAAEQHEYEIRCYIRDPDGHLIEVGQTTDRRVTGLHLNGSPVCPAGARVNAAIASETPYVAGAQSPQPPISLPVTSGEAAKESVILWVLG